MNSLGRRSPTMQGPVSSGRSYLSRLLPRPAWLLALTLGLASPASAQAPGTWAPIADLNQPRAEHTATLLANGTVLISGGRDAADQPLASAEIYDPATGGYTLLASPLPAPVWGHTATRLGDGTVVIAGGTGDGGLPVAAVQLFDPATDTFTALDPMSTPRARHTATLLHDGRVVVIGGTDGSKALASLEVYDPTTRTFSLAPRALAVARQDHTATLLPDGRVLVAGGSNSSGVLESAELYDPTTGAFRPVDSPGTARRLFGANFFELPYTGILLATGGFDTSDQPLASSEVFFYPTLRSDKPDYAPGETVTLMGEGWRPNEQVAINIHESSGDPDTDLTATADVNGAFTNSEFQTNPDRSDVGVRFLAPATGQASRWTAQTTFTDGNVKAMAAPSGTTFTLTKSVFSNTTCSGTPSSTTTVTGVNSTSGNTTGVGNTESVRL